jgi:hypothetical protein
MSAVKRNERRARRKRLFLLWWLGNSAGWINKRPIEDGHAIAAYHAVNLHIIVSRLATTLTCPVIFGPVIT